MNAVALLPIAWWLAAPALAADDPLHSAACEHAMQHLHAEEQRILDTHRPGPTPALKKAQGQVAAHCLRERDPSRPAPLRQRFATPPVEVPPVGMPPVAAPRAPALPAAALPPAPAPLVTITSCDATGCWTSNGTHLNRVGGALIGPQGVCTETAGVLSCR